MSDIQFEFSDKEYQESDSLLAGSNENDHLAMTNSGWSITHNHDNQSVILTQRFTKMHVNEDGFSAKMPHQSTMIIPLHQLEIVMTLLMTEAECLLGENSND